MANEYLYNDKELLTDADLGWYDYGFRNYDPQIGRFPQLDPLTDDYPYLTPYQYAGNEPIANVDLDGLEPLPSIINPGQWFMPQTLGGVTVSAVRHTTQAVSVTTKAVGSVGNVAKAFLVAGTSMSSQQIITKMTTQTATQTATRTGLFSGLGGMSLRFLGTVGAVLTPLSAGADMPEETGGNETYYQKNYLERITDPAGASDAYLAEVQRRFMEGTQTANDYRYREEIDRRLRSGSSNIGILIDRVKFRRDHILNRHRAGSGKPGKTEFPASWSDDEIINAVNRIANDPSVESGMGRWNSPYKIGTINGIRIRVDFYPIDHSDYAGQVSTAYPVN